MGIAARSETRRLGENLSCRGAADYFRAMPHPFQFFDRDAEVAISHRRLPHWEQAGVTYFVTFRTADSIPEPALKEWTYERNMWLRRHGINPLVGDVQEGIEGLPKRDQDEFRDTFSKKWHAFLDCCYGQCVLRTAALSEIVAESLGRMRRLTISSGAWSSSNTSAGTLPTIRREQSCRRESIIITGMMA